MRYQPLGVSTGWMAGLAPNSWDSAILEAQAAFVNDPQWLAWWNTLERPDDIFAFIWIENRQKPSHRVTKPKGEIHISLGLPVQEATAASDLAAYLRKQESNLWHRAAKKLNWPKPPDSEPAPAK